jgi:hypothetical protein
MYVQWQGLSVVKLRRAHKAIRNYGYSVAKCQQQTDAVCDVWTSNRARGVMTEESFYLNGTMS